MPDDLKKFRGFFQKKLFSLVWVSMVLFSLVLISFYFVLLLPSLASIKKEIVAIHFGIAQNSRDKVQGFLDENVKSLNDLAQIISEIEEGREKKVIIDRFLKERKVFTQITTTDSEGQEILKISKFSVFTSEDLKDISWSESFARAIEGEIYLSAVYSSENYDPFLTISLPIKPSPDQIAGVLSAELSLREIWDIVSEIKVGEAGLIYLVDSHGYLIAHPDIQLVLKKANLLKRRVVEEVIIGKKNVTGLDSTEEYVNEKGEKVCVVGLPLEKVGWGIFVEDPTKDTWSSYRAIRDLGLISIIVAISLFLILFLGVMVLARTLGDLKKSKTALEIKTEELEKMKNFLEIRVKERTKELKELAESLEEKVKVRTKELRIKMEELEKFNRLATGRELKMIELKKEIKNLTKDHEK